jgi:hypothetical protein
VTAIDFRVIFMNATNIPPTVVEVRPAKHLKGELAPDNFDVVGSSAGQIANAPARRK